MHIVFFHDTSQRECTWRLCPSPLPCHGLATMWKHVPALSLRHISNADDCSTQSPETRKQEAEPAAATPKYPPSSPCHRLRPGPDQFPAVCGEAELKHGRVEKLAAADAIALTGRPQLERYVFYYLKYMYSCTSSNACMCTIDRSNSSSSNSSCEHV